MMGGAQPMSSLRYTLSVINSSMNSFDVCLYQTYPGVDVGSFPLAWLVGTVSPNLEWVCAWSVDEWSFLWAETGVLAPGVQFDYAQEWPADPRIQQPAGPSKAGDCVGLTRAQENYMFFQLPSEPPVPAGQLAIMNDETVLGGQVSVGIGNSGAAVAAVQAMPSRNVTFNALQPSYFIAATENLRQGEVLDLAGLPGSAALVFPPNVDCLTAVYGADGRWHITPDRQPIDSVHEKKMVTH